MRFHLRSYGRGGAAKRDVSRMKLPRIDRKKPPTVESEEYSVFAGRPFLHEREMARGAGDFFGTETRSGSMSVLAAAAALVRTIYYMILAVKGLRWNLLVPESG